MATNFAGGFWRLADPKISLASAASMLLGASAAAVAGPLSVGWLAVTVLGIFAVEVAKNASGEIFDWDSGTDRRIRPEDRSPFSGGKRVLVDGLLTRRQTWAIAIGGYLLAMVAGLAIVRWRAPGVLWIGVAGLALAFFYHAPPISPELPGLGRARRGGLLRTADLRRHLPRPARHNADRRRPAFPAPRPPGRGLPLDQRIPRSMPPTRSRESARSWCAWGAVEPRPASQPSASPLPSCWPSCRLLGSHGRSGWVAWRPSGTCPPRAC